MDGKLDTGFTGDFRIGRYASPVAVDTGTTADIPRLYYLKAREYDLLGRNAIMKVLDYVIGRDAYSEAEELLAHCGPEDQSDGLIACCTQSELDTVMRTLVEEELYVDVELFKKMRKEHWDRWAS